MLEEIDDMNIFNLPLEDRKEIIEQSSEVLITKCIHSSQRMGVPLQKVLSDVIHTLEMKKEIELELENYEMCYLYEELIWGVKDRINKAKIS
jgi:predicted aldo/keto reductase-like oxidoreductase